MRGISAPAAAMLMCLSASVPAVETPPEGAPAPDFIGDGWSDGGGYSWRRVAGKVVVLSFYNSGG